MDITVRLYDTPTERIVPITGCAMLVSKLQSLLYTMFEVPVDRRYLMFKGKR
eukprot:Ihof_evm7s331 gene=Ihof_evmTU7s331